MKDNEIKLLKNNDRREWSDVEWIQEFKDFLMGEVPEGIILGKRSQVKLTDAKADAIIWYLQEHFSILPDHIEMCNTCGKIYDSWSEGIYWETKGKNYCGSCDYLVPLNYDRGKR